jgi:hypothetical protein
MFNKKNCRRCEKKFDKNFDYCPHCGSFAGDPAKDKKDFGMLGKDDFDMKNFANEVRLPLGFNTIFKKLMKEMDVQFRELDREIGQEKDMAKRAQKNPNMPNIRQGGISINISSGAGAPVIKVKSFGNMPEFQELQNQIAGKEKRKQERLPMPQIDEEKSKKFAKLPRQEAQSKVRRLSGKVVYEIDLPGVKNIKDVIVNQLENSIEVKAFAEDKAYFKFLPVSLPLLKYKLDNDKLVMELGER